MSKKTKKPRSGNEFDKIILKYVPKFFEVLGWTALLGVLQYIARATNNWAVWVIYGTSLIGMIYYIQVYVYTNLPAKSDGRKRSIILILGAVFAISIWLLLHRVIGEMAEASVN